MPQAKSSKRTGKAKGYTPISTDGKLYRVRDKDYGDGGHVQIWGENLTYEAARALKEKVCGTKRSRTARVEEMSVSMPSADPTLETVRHTALSAGRAAAGAAQARADALAARRRLEAKAASSPKPLRPQPNVKHKPVAMESLDADLEVPDVEDEDEVEDIPEDPATAQAEVDAEMAEYDRKGAELYAAYTAAELPAPEAGWATWDKLSEKERAGFRFEALHGQGPHVEVVGRDAWIARAGANGSGDHGIDEISGGESAPS